MKRMNWMTILITLLLAGCASAGEFTHIPDSWIDPGIDPAAFAHVPAGEFFEGRHEHLVDIAHDFEIMITDVTVAQYAAFLNAALADGSLSSSGTELLVYFPGEPFDGYDHEVEIPAGDKLVLQLDNVVLPLLNENGELLPIETLANHPMTSITWFGANAYCQYFGWRLPGELEWEKAARGTDTRPFPWGDSIASANANYYSSHDTFQKLFAGQGGTTPVGFYNGQTYDGFETIDSASPYGLYDMAGNVWQWVGDDYPDTHLRYMRGGSRMDYAYNLRVWMRNSAGPDYHSPSVGFRCAR